MAAPTVLAVDDVAVARDWWTRALGFTTTFVHRSPGDADILNYAVVERDDVEVHLARRSELTDRRRAELVIVVADLDGFASELASRGVAHRRPAPAKVVVDDPTGNRLVFRAADDVLPPG